MDKVKKFFENLSSDDSDNLIRQIKDILFSNVQIHILYGVGANGKTSLLHVLKNIMEDKMFHLPYKAVCSDMIENAYIPYILDCEYIVIEDILGGINEKILLQLTNGFLCQYHKPFTNNWSQVKVTPKKVIIVTNINPKNLISEQILQKANILHFGQLKNQDIGLVCDVSNNYHKDVYEYLVNH